MDYSLMKPTTCLASRPGYKCEPTAVHYEFSPGALSGACDVLPPFQPSSFPRDHLMDMFASFRGGRGTGGTVDGPAPVVLFVARERGEHANLFHATTDLMNAFFSLTMLGIVDGVRGSREGMADVAVVLLDAQEGPFEDAFWGKVFSPNHPVQRPSLLGNTRVKYQRAVFVPPGYSNLLLHAVMSEGDCHAVAGSHLFHAYRRFVLRGLGASEAVVNGATSPIDAPLQATFVSRRPYQRHGVDHSSVGRQIDNEDALLERLLSVPGVQVTRSDFAQLEVEEQIALVARSDILIGMHGAALTHALYLPPHAGLLELWPKPGEIWRVFEHAATLAGLHYERWSNGAYPDGYRTDGTGDYTTVDVAVLGGVFEGMVASIAKRRREASAAANAHEPWPR